jgi:hypothetical protein
MPIRFRCSSCNQLMGISRRKAGTVVHCPTCNHPVEVPAEDAAGEESVRSPVPPSPAPVPAPAPAAAGELFERDDFDALLRGSAGGPEPRLSRPAAAHTAFPHVPPAPAAPPAPPPLLLPEESYKVGPWGGPPAVGLVLSPARATVLTVAVILLLAVAFGSGLIVGRFYL